MSIHRVERYVEDMLKGDKFPPIKVDGNIIADGHHRFIASKIAKAKIDTVPGARPSFKQNQPSKDLVELIFSKSDF